MRYRILLLAAVLASGLAGAETIAVDNGIAVKPSDIATPTATPSSDTQVIKETKKLCSRASEYRRPTKTGRGWNMSGDESLNGPIKLQHYQSVN